MNILMRSLLFLPANNSKYINHALEGNADVIILDLEDSVPKHLKQEARKNIIEYSRNNRFEHKKVIIRINEMESKEFFSDVTELCLKGIDGFMPSKIESADDIVFLDRLISLLEIKNGLPKGSFFLAPLIETTKAIIQVNQIAFASDRIAALCFGGEDYLNDLGSVYTYQESAFSFPRAAIVNACRAAHILPIDTPYLNKEDSEGFANKAKAAYKNGFAGCLLINPKQIEIANTNFSPDDEQIKSAEEIIEAVRKSEIENASGVAIVKGAMVGPPMRKRAENILRQSEAMGRILLS